MTAGPQVDSRGGWVTWPLAVSSRTGKVSTANSRPCGVAAQRCAAASACSVTATGMAATPVWRERAGHQEGVELRGEPAKPELRRAGHEHPRLANPLVGRGEAGL